LTSRRSHGSPVISTPDHEGNIYTLARSPSLKSASSQLHQHQQRRRANSGGSSSHSPPASSHGSGKEEKTTLCQECNKSFRDLRAHQLTHQLERPEKCPIATCEYSKKGFARKYDCQRHTLTHYKGTMVCGFCPGSGSAMEKSFNRADVFKRHLMAVHNVEQTAPNGRQKKASKGKVSTSTAAAAAAAPDLDEYSSSGKCSTCGLTFATAQQFYEHLDDCVLSKVIEEEPAAAANEKNLAQVKLEDVEAALSQPTTTTTLAAGSVEYLSADEDDDDGELFDISEAEDNVDDATDGTFFPSSAAAAAAAGSQRRAAKRQRSAAVATMSRKVAGRNR
jgi:hypothetical protein